MDQTKVAQVLEFLEGTCRTVFDVKELLGLDDSYDDIYLALETDGLELCDICGWWCESSEMDLIDSVTNACEDCREELEDEYSE